MKRVQIHWQIVLLTSKKERMRKNPTLMELIFTQMRVDDIRIDKNVYD